MSTQSTVHLPPVVITRPEEQVGSLMKLLSAYGFVSELIPCIAIRGLPLSAAMLAIFDRLQRGEFDWLVLSSANGARFLGERWREARGADTPFPKGVRIAVQGVKSAEGVAAHLGCRADFVPTVSVAEPFAAELVERLTPESSILLVGAAESRGVIERVVEQAGMLVTGLPVYRTEPAAVSATDDCASLRERLQAHVRSGSVFTFYSPSAVRGMSNLLGGSLHHLRDHTVVTVGPVTTRALRDAGGLVTIEADDHTDEGVVEALRSFFDLPK